MLNPLEGSQWPALRNLGRQWLAVVEEARQLKEALPPAQAEQVPPGGGWTVAQCYDHLNLTLETYLKDLEPALAAARTPARRNPRLDFWGWLLCRSLDPKRRWKMKTTAAFVPEPSGHWPEIIERFQTLHERVAHLFTRSADRDLESVKVASPFAPRIRYHAYSAFRLILIHDQRHQAQAREAAGLTTHR